jgi:hypothetical protein
LKTSTYVHPVTEIFQVKVRVQTSNDWEDIWNKH